MDTEDLYRHLSERVLPELKPKIELQDYITARIPPFNPLDQLANWPAHAERLRERYLDEVVFRGVPEAWRSPTPSVVWGDVLESGAGYRIRKLRYEAVPGLWIPALLYEPEQLRGTTPAVLNVNGHVGPPGKAIAYKQIRCINLAKRGLLALNPEWLYFGELQGSMRTHNRAGYLDLVGVSGLAVLFLAMQRGLDVLLEHPNCDAERVAVTGLSGGGWQTIVLSALDPRVRMAVPVAGYIGLEQRTQCRGDIGDLEQNASDLVRVGDYTWLTALLAPRPALLIYNDKDDCCFQAPRARASVYDPVLPLYEALGAGDRFAFHANYDPGTHNYELDNRQQFYRFLKRHGYTAETASDDEIPSDDKVRSQSELNVGLPARNADFRTLALACAKGLPRRRVLARTAAGLTCWQRTMRPRVAAILRYEEPTIQASLVSTCTDAGIEVRRWQLRTSDGFTLPAVECTCVGGASGGTVLVVTDAGRTGLPDAVERARARKRRVVALDVVMTGEYSIAGTPCAQVAMMLATAGERLLGLQVAQAVAAARWLSALYGGPLTLLGAGRESGVAALLSAGLGAPVDVVVAQNAPISLRILIETGVHYDECPGLFGFGLLETLDVREMIALALPREVVLVSPEGRPSLIRSEMAVLSRLARAAGGRGPSVCPTW